MGWRKCIVLSVVIVATMLHGCKTTQKAQVEEKPASKLYSVKNVEPQPLVAAAQRLNEALAYLGGALQDSDRQRIEAIVAEPQNERTSREIQEILDPYCLAMVNINPEARVKVVRGPAPANLVQQGWRSFLIKVHNESGTRAQLAWESPNADPVLHASSGAPEPRAENFISPGEVQNRFLELKFYENPNMSLELSGLPLEYKILQIYTKDTGPRDATIGFNVGQGTEDLGYRNALHLLFDCKAATRVVFRVKDDDGTPTTASFIIRDNIQRLGPKPDYRSTKATQGEYQRLGLDAKPLVGVYPLPARRVADMDEYPDFFFQPQIYRQDGEHIFLPPGEYEVTYNRGPEYLPQVKTITVKEGAKDQEEEFQLKRWINMAKLGWSSGDHHVHGGGCSHYESPAAGVKPEAMLRQAKGEDLNISCVLTWGPCWYNQKKFFEGEINKLSTDQNVMRYDVEVSGFPGHAGHICLLRLAEDDYPGTQLIEQWPTWTMPILQWAKEQGGVVGYAHSGWGLEPVEATKDLPNYVMAKFDGIGANEYIVTVTHGACDFISAGDTPIPYEMNIWYHTLNCGFRATISGETDYPCIYDERLGMARSYIKLGGPLNFDNFVQRTKDGANYVCDGRSHLMDFTINGVAMGEKGSDVNLSKAGKVTATATVAAYLPEEQSEAGAKIAEGGLQGRPYWHLEKARIAGSRKVPVELLMNGYPIARKEIEADGSLQPVSFEVPVKFSSWFALRILGSSHTNPIYVEVGGKPIHASKRSAEWCRDAVDQCWKMKQGAIRAEELEAAKAAYDSARNTYDAIVLTSVDDTK